MYESKKEKNNALIIVPHQDDEINLVGNIIDVLKKKWNIILIYSSLSTDIQNAEIRKQEAIDSCSIFGIDKRNLYFWGYPDTPNYIGTHFYSSNPRPIIEDIKKELLKLWPKIIFVTDFDFHSDHRMISLAFDTAMGEILKEYDYYRPIVLKGFCYETAFYAKEDYKAFGLEKTVINKQLLSNPSFEWENRFSIESIEKNGFIFQKKAYKALKKHKSQYAILHARSIINADNVFWLKRTDNLAFNAAVESDLVNADALIDFKIIDTKDIIKLNPREIDYSKGICHLEKKKGTIVFKWRNPVQIDRVVFHGNPNCRKTQKLDISIYGDNTFLTKTNAVREYGRETLVIFELITIKELKIMIYTQNGKAEFSEIELFCGEKAFPNISNSIHNNKPNLIGIETLINYLDYFLYKIIVVKTKIYRKLNNIYSYLLKKRKKI